MVHSQKCLNEQAKIAKAIKAFDAKYPNFCKKCDGAGLHVSNGSYWVPPDVDPCDACVGQGKCPMCGKQHGDDWQGDACECGWNWDGDGVEHRPEYDEFCSCEFEPKFIIEDEPLTEEEFDDALAYDALHEDEHRDHNQTVLRRAGF